MLKITILSKKFISRQLEFNNNNSEIDKFGIYNTEKIAKNSEKLSKSQKSAKSKKKLFLRKNLSNFDIKKIELSF